MYHEAHFMHNVKFLLKKYSYIILPTSHECSYFLLIYDEKRYTKKIRGSGRGLVVRVLDSGL